MNERTIIVGRDGNSGYPIGAKETRADAGAGVRIEFHTPENQPWLTQQVLETCTAWCEGLNGGIRGTASATRRGPNINVNTFGDMDLIRPELPRLYDSLEHLSAPAQHAEGVAAPLAAG